MSSINDLLNNVIKRDTIGTHDWADDLKWQKYPPGGWVSGKDSSFTIVPPPGCALIINGARVRYSKNAKMHSPLNVEYYAGETKIGETVYNDQGDFFDRFDGFDVLAVENGTDMPKNIWSHEYEFDEPLIIWSSVGVHGKFNLPKINRLVVSIEDDEPYMDGQDPPQPIGLARVRYMQCMVCVDPD